MTEDEIGNVVELEHEGTELIVVKNGIKIAKRKNDRWISLVPGIEVRDCKRGGIEIIYSGTEHWP